jgi:hypothetical protein
MNRTIFISTIVLAAGSQVLADETVWIPIEIEGQATTNAYADNVNWDGQEQEWEQDSESVDIASFAEFPAEAAASASTGMSSSSSDARLDGFLWETGFSIAVDGSTSAFGFSDGGSDSVGSGQEDAWVEMTAKLYGETFVDVEGWLSATGMNGVGIADISIFDEVAESTVATWSADAADLEIDDRLRLQPGYYTFRVSISAGSDAGYDPSSIDAWTSEHAGLEVSFSPRRPGDINADGVVDGNDLGKLFANWGTDDSDSDVNGDGIVNGSDIGLLFANWG